MEKPKLQWIGAEVRDGTLTVRVAGDRPKGWKATFEQTVRLLGGGDWGEVKLKSDRIRVIEAREGSEDQLRHFLEGVVQEANSAHIEDDHGAEDHDQQEGAFETGVDDVDGRLTERFRDFDAT